MQFFLVDRHFQDGRSDLSGGFRAHLSITQPPNFLLDKNKIKPELQL